MINNAIIPRSRFLSIHILMIIVLLLFDGYVSALEVGSSVVPIRVVLDTSSTMGSMAELCMKMAASDFYEKYPNYSTRVDLYTRNAGSVLDANFAVVDLLKEEAVQGVIGPQGSPEETFFAQLGQNVHVPIISFASSSSSSSSYTDNRYFVRSTPDDYVQAQALAAVCRGFQWSKFAVLYEDTDSGSQFVSLLNKAFQEVEISLEYMVAIPSSAEDRRISKELEKLATRKTRVFLVHMSPALGSRFFPLAKKAGVVSEGYAWLITNSLSIFMNSMDSGVHDSMEGVLGIRPYLSRSKDLDSFRERWRRNATLNSSNGSVMELNAYGLWAYDAVTALAISVEKINSSISNTRAAISGTYKNLSVSTFGPELLKELSNIKFNGLSGDFELADGKLKPSAFEIFNVIGIGEKTVGFWVPEKGIVRDIRSTTYSTSAAELKSITWPGDSLTRPMDWAIPTSGKLRVGIPWKHGFLEFVDVPNPARSPVEASGFSIDIFLATLESVPFHIDYEFILYNDTQNINWSYDDMLHKILEEFDMVVGDTTNWAPRAEYVDFSLPYSESGVVLVVKNKKPFDMWIFVKPLRWDLWLAIFVTCGVVGLVLLVLERRVASSGTGPMRTPMEKSGMVYWSPLAALAFPDRNMVLNSWSVLVLVFWLFMAFILMQSYTANLSAILTVDQLKFAFSDNYYLGYKDGSFMKNFLTDQLHISASRLRSYTSAEEYHEAMNLGSKNGGIDAIFDEIPYMKILLNKYDPQYKMAGPTYRIGGFGFAFPKGSTLTSQFSKAILDVTQGSNMTAIEQKNFGPGYSSQDPQSSTISQGTSSLSFYEFAGLFIVTGTVIAFALFCSETPVGRKLSVKTRQFVHSLINYKVSRLSPVEETSVSGESSDDFLEPVQNNATSPPPSSRHGELEMHDISLSDETPAAHNSGARGDGDGENSVEDTGS